MPLSDREFLGTAGRKAVDEGDRVTGGQPLFSEKEDLYTEAQESSQRDQNLKRISFELSRPEVRKNARLTSILQEEQARLMKTSTGPADPLYGRTLIGNKGKITSADVGDTAVAKTALTDDEFLSGAKPGTSIIGAKPELDSPSQKALRAIKIMGGGLAPVADFFLNIPFAFPLEVGGGVGGAAKALIKGEDPNEAFMIGRDVGRQFAEPISNPVQKIFKALDNEQLYNESLTQKGLEKVSNLIESGDKWMHQNVKLPSGQPFPEGAFSQLVNVAMFGMGRKGQIWRRS